MTVGDLGHGATDLVSLSTGEARSLSKLAEMTVRQVPGCAAAHVTIWRDGEVAAVAASHPDPAELVDLQLRMGDRAAAARHARGDAGEQRRYASPRTAGRAGRRRRSAVGSAPRCTW